ncbi:MAG: dihydrodipicolinate synthase family protein [Proteobacteria bacterium]|nr:dihydrodipicolinate synthase family protein [Pseudomonadota bacterium]MBU1742083.1 dihydrodipicolinate synthase family protein [Pseudomonadota bacterium]
MSLPRGHVVELVTPLTEGGRLDETSLARLIDRVRPSADAVWLAGVRVGELLTLPDDVWSDVVRTGLELLGPKVPVLIGVTGHDASATRGRIEAAARLVADSSREGIVLVADLPLWYHSNRGLPEIMAEWGRLAPGEMVLVNHPPAIKSLQQTAKHANIRTEVLKKLSALPEIMGLIYTGDARRESNYRRAVRTRPDFLIYDYDELNFLGRPSSAGVVGSGGNLLPGVWRRLVDASLGRAGQVARFADYQRQLLGWSSLARVLAGLMAADPVRVLKRALRVPGIIDHETTTAPGPALDPDRAKAVDAWLSEHQRHFRGGE